MAAVYVAESPAPEGHGLWRWLTGHCQLPCGGVGDDVLNLDQSTASHLQVLIWLVT